VPKILIVDDEVDFAKELRATLEQQGWRVDLASTGADAMQFLTNFRFDFILLDWNLPEMTGVEICRKFRSSGGDAPIIFLTGRNTIDDKETGFDAGGDDYLTKPFNVRELLARINALKRRPGKYGQKTFSARGVTLDPDLRTVCRTTGSSVQLSTLESAILEFLLRHKNRLFSASELFEAVWDLDAEASEETVRVRISVIRQKLAKIGAGDLIETVRRNGYVIRDDSGR
jgi:DNA-binding response OmpR family regulator